MYGEVRIGDHLVLNLAVAVDNVRPAARHLPSEGDLGDEDAIRVAHGLRVGARVALLALYLQPKVRRAGEIHELLDVAAAVREDAEGVVLLPREEQRLRHRLDASPRRLLDV